MYLVDFPFSGRNLGRRIEQPAASQHQIGEAKQREQLSGVLGQSPVARLAMTEQVLHHVEGMLNLGANAGLGVLDPL